MFLVQSHDFLSSKAAFPATSSPARAHNEQLRPDLAVILLIVSKLTETTYTSDTSVGEKWGSKKPSKRLKFARFFLFEADNNVSSWWQHIWKLRFRATTLKRIEAFSNVSGFRSVFKCLRIQKRFQMSPFPKTKASVFDRCSVVARWKRIENDAFSNENALMWLRAKSLKNSISQRRITLLDSLWAWVACEHSKENSLWVSAVLYLYIWRDCYVASVAGKMSLSPSVSRVENSCGLAWKQHLLRLKTTLSEKL